MHRARLKTALIALIRDLTVSSDFVYGYTFRDGVQRGWEGMCLRAGRCERYPYASLRSPENVR